MRVEPRSVVLDPVGQESSRTRSARAPAQPVRSSHARSGRRFSRAAHLLDYAGRRLGEEPRHSSSRVVADVARDRGCASASSTSSPT